ncbi:pyridoxal-phosphate-dependent aminotransferase family protein [candidate division KSB1 bacterium]
MQYSRVFDIQERVLMGPGPSNVNPRVLQAMGVPTIGHLDPEFLKIMDEVQDLLRWLFNTKNRLTMPISATGSAGMEATFANAFERGEKVLIGVNGVFGTRMTQVAKKFGQIPVIMDTGWGSVFEPEKIKEELDKYPDIKGVALVHAETSTGACQPLEEVGEICRDKGVIFLVDAVTSLGGIPVKIDEWNIDVCYSGTQKCLSCPPGLSPVTFSEKALEKMNNRQTEVESWYLDLSMLQKYWTTGERVYHHTAPINMIYAIHESLLILKEEGLDAIHARHKLNSKALLAGLEAIGIKPVVEEEFRLPELNSVYIPEGADDKKVRGDLLNRFGIEIGAGLGPLAGKIWRIGIMGQSSNQNNVVYFLASLEQILKETGILTAVGKAVAAAQEVYSE